MSHIALMYGVTEDEVREAEHHAALAPLVPIRAVLRGALAGVLEQAVEGPQKEAE